MVEVVVEVSERWIDLCLNMRLQLFSQHAFPILSHRQQVRKEDPSVVPNEPLHVLLIDLMGKLIAAIQLGPRGKTHLLKEERNASTDLQIAYHVFLKSDYLLSFTEVSNISVLVHSPVEISRSTLAVAASCDQDVSHFTALQKDFKTLHKALNERTTPAEGHFVFVKFTEEPIVPDKSFSKCLLCLQTKRQGKVVLIGEVEATFEDDVILPNLPVNLLPLWSILEHSIISISQEEQ